MDWFLYDIGLRRERVKMVSKNVKICYSFTKILSGDVRGVKKIDISKAFHEPDIATKIDLL